MFHDMLIGLGVILAASTLAQGLRSTPLATASNGPDRPAAHAGLLGDGKGRLPAPAADRPIRWASRVR